MREVLIFVAGMLVGAVLLYVGLGIYFTWWK